MSHRRCAGQQPMLYPTRISTSTPRGLSTSRGSSLSLSNSTWVSGSTLPAASGYTPGYPPQGAYPPHPSGYSPLQMYQPGYMEPADSSDGLEAKIDYLENCERRLSSGQALGTEEVRHLVSCRMETLLRKRHKKMKNVRRKRDRMEDVLSDSELDYYVV